MCGALPLCSIHLLLGSRHFQLSVMEHSPLLSALLKLSSLIFSTACEFNPMMPPREVKPLAQSYSSRTCPSSGSNPSLPGLQSCAFNHYAVRGQHCSFVFKKIKFSYMLLLFNALETWWTTHATSKFWVSTWSFIATLDLWCAYFASEHAELVYERKVATSCYGNCLSLMT